MSNCVFLQAAGFIVPLWYPPMRATVTEWPAVSTSY